MGVFDTIKKYLSTSRRCSVKLGEFYQGTLTINLTRASYYTLVGPYRVTLRVSEESITAIDHQGVALTDIEIAHYLESFPIEGVVVADGKLKLVVDVTKLDQVLTDPRDLSHQSPSTPFTKTKKGYELVICQLKNDTPICSFVNFRARDIFTAGLNVGLVVEHRPIL